MRAHATDPTHELEVVTTHGWPQMRWGRIPALVPHWAVKTIDTTDLDSCAVGATVESWIGDVLSGAAPSIDPRVT